MHVQASKAPIRRCITNVFALEPIEQVLLSNDYPAAQQNHVGRV